MKVFSTSQIRQCDAFTIEHEPISSADLMERAAQSIFQWIQNKIGKEYPIVVFAGMGNNGGDALALARLLALDGFKNLNVFLLHVSGNFSSDCEQNFSRLLKLGKVPVHQIFEQDIFPSFEPHTVVIDGIFGTGLTRPISGYWALCIEHINKFAGKIISIDIPSGLLADSPHHEDAAIIRATYTMTFQFPKLSFFFAENSSYLGRWEVLDIGLHQNYIHNTLTPFQSIEVATIRNLVKSRNRFAHKGDFGHAFLVAGSYQKTGAAVLSARACLRSGVGLLTVHVPQSGYQIMQTAIPEAMLCIDETESAFCHGSTLEKFDAIGIGPGIGLKQGIRGAFKLLLQTSRKPMVLDADALNIIADTTELIKLIPPNTILTPHPGEFDRLTHKHSKGFDRFLTQQEFSKQHRVIVVLKGAFSSISTPDGCVYFNTTGNPGMATAGSGDVLTGIILSLLAQGYSPLDASIVGVFIHGLAGDIASGEKSEEAIIASDIIECMGKAFVEIKGKKDAKN